jgi:hypothetical protein
MPRNIAARAASTFATETVNAAQVGVVYRVPVCFRKNLTFLCISLAFASADKETIKNVA